MDSQHIVYGLIDPRNGELRYVGMSSNGISRAKEHAKPKYYATRRPVYCWIHKLRTLGLKYEIEILEAHATREDAYEAEQF